MKSVEKTRGNSKLEPTHPPLLSLAANPTSRNYHYPCLFIYNTKYRYISSIRIEECTAMGKWNPDLVKNPRRCPAIVHFPYLNPNPHPPRAPEDRLPTASTTLNALLTEKKLIFPDKEASLSTAPSGHVVRTCVTAGDFHE
eukprot:1358776-Amorphochlora_amoeboformis.AAC.1